MPSTTHSFINCATFLDVDATEDIDESQGSCTRSVLDKIHTYHMEYDPYATLAQLPQCFVREFGDLIDAYVILQDPNYNEFQVHVIKKTNYMFFGQGWSVLGSVYDIWFGAWLTFTYVNPKLLHISLTTRWETDVNYPQHRPPLRHILTMAGSDSINDSSILLKNYIRPALPQSFRRSFLKKMTAYDIESGILVLPWYGFGESAFAFTFTDIILMDHTGASYPCSIDFAIDHEGELSCKISGGWADLCRTHRLVEGSKVRFADNEPVINYVIYVCVYPQIGIETTLNYPLNDGSYLPLCVSQHYFVAYS